MKEWLNAWLYDTASALTYSVAETHEDASRPEFQPPYNELTRFVLEQQARMPDYLRKPFAALTLGFDLAGGLHKFHGKVPAARAKQIAAWKESGSAFRRDLVRYYESLATLALYSRMGGEADATQAAETSTENFRAQVMSEPASELKFEIVVVGSGPGGAITAALLAEAGREVLLIEEGEYLALSSCAPFSQVEMVQKYRNGGQTVALGANKISYVEGKCVGGGSEINSGLYHRTPPEVLEQWQREFHLEAAGEREMREHFEACEKDVSVSRLPGAAPVASLKLHEGATRLGWKSLEIPRWFRYTPGSTDAGSGKRQSMTETYIPRFFKSGGRLLPRTRVERISQENGRWTLRARHAAKGELSIQAETLFICGGAVQTPALLRRSGITRNIGNSLRLHPTIKVVAKFAEAVNSAQMGVPVHQVKEFAPRYSFGCSISNPPYLALALLEHPEAAKTVSREWAQLATYYAMITGEGRGTVRSVPGHRDALVRYKLTGNDRRDLAEGLRKLCEALFAGGAAALYPGITKSAELMKKDDLGKMPEIVPSGMASLMTIHLFSSCPMGEDREKCAVDSFGRVRGFKNLHVADASLLCTAPGVNPQGSVMAFARRNVVKYLQGKR